MNVVGLNLVRKAIMNKIIILNVVWVFVAVGAFYLGRNDEPNGSEAKISDGGGKNRSSQNRSSQVRSSSSEGGKKGGSQSAKTNGLSQGVTLAQYQRETDALVANKLFADLLLTLKAENAREVFEALLEKRKNGGENGEQMAFFLEAWGKLDGEAALAAVEELGGDGRRRGFASISAMKGWASSDPTKARAHLEGLEAGFEKGMLVQGVVSGMASVDPQSATEFVLEMDEARRAEGGDGEEDRWRGFATDRQMEAIARAQMQQGMPQATAWAESLPDGSIKSSAFDRVAENFAQSDPAAAAEWVKSHADQEYAERAVREVSEELSRKDPAAAVSWAEELPEATQASAMRQSIEQWTRQDAEAAGQYLTTMEESASRDAAVSSFARTLDREDPVVAAEWAASISDEGTRNETLQSVGRSWVQTDAEAAKAWLPNSGLSEEAQAEVIESAARGGGRRPGR